MSGDTAPGTTEPPEHKAISTMQAGQEDATEQTESQTASEFINSQLQLEADAREALPYSFDRCTKPLGPLRQNIFSCLTCNPPPATPSDAYQPAGVCYACSIACHGEHTLVELFAHRNFTCDCGTTRLSSSSCCTLRIDPVSGTKGPVHSETAATGNTYNRNFQNRFCGCGELYDAHTERGTMYQCLGLATEQDGGCGEDWWHPECLMGLARDWHKKEPKHTAQATENTSEEAQVNATTELPVPDGFPDEDAFETLICYKCVEANPWIKKYGGSDGFIHLPFASTERNQGTETRAKLSSSVESSLQSQSKSDSPTDKGSSDSRKRKAEDEADLPDLVDIKRTKTEDLAISQEQDAPAHAHLPPAPDGRFSLFAREENFRDRFCRCAECYQDLRQHPQLVEEEDTYEPPISEEGDEPAGSVGTGSLLDRGEAALSNVDRVRAIEGVMAYNHLKEKVKAFLQPFAESGQAVGAEDIKSYFASLRGDDQAVVAGAAAVMAGEDGPDGDNRREQSG